VVKFTVNRQMNHNVGLFKGLLLIQ